MLPDVVHIVIEPVLRLHVREGYDRRVQDDAGDAGGAQARENLVLRRGGGGVVRNFDERCVYRDAGGGHEEAVGVIAQAAQGDIAAPDVCDGQGVQLVARVGVGVEGHAVIGGCIAGGGGDGAVGERGDGDVVGVGGI